jgi:hypothetical protein
VRRLRSRLLRFVLGRAARRIRWLALKGRPLQLRFAMWVTTIVFRRVWRRLEPHERMRLRELLVRLARQRRLAPGERAELERLARKLRGRLWRPAAPLASAGQ